MEFKLDGAKYIELQALLKATGLCGSGSEAKYAIIEGRVTVDSIVETRRGKKIIAGQIISFADKKITVIA